ncbi:LysR family transcriptional regulator [Gluconobacter morbifer G707]|uniref:LysR family transcriptional regulator n=1 Tax=Gluconobacter morbifer G707 TaxID=1088869 RepID=G6XK37_9PROT|nr:LysR family transcriptional regulator [Gluconobacter morbifer G707]
MLERFLTEYPAIRVDLTTDYGRTDIVRERHDAGIRRSQLVPKDMIALQIGQEIPMSVVGTRIFSAGIPFPEHPVISRIVPTSICICPSMANC